MTQQTFTTVGQSVRRIDGLDKVSGRAEYAVDVVVPGMAYGKLVPSPLPHALITSIDASKARALPGVYAVLTGAELVNMETHYGSDKKDRPIVAMGKVRFQGEPVAAVAAIDLQTAEAAAELIEVEYEELSAASDIASALAEGAAPIHDSNWCHEYGYEWGDVDEAFKGCDRIYEDTFTFPMVYHYAMEPHSCVASFEGDRLRVWTSAQHPFLVRAELARIFRLQLDEVQVIVPYVGGGYGSKSYTKIEPLVMALSREAGRPVRLAQSVEESMKTVRRHAAKATVRTGVMNDGTFVARECLSYVDTGGYTDNGVRVTERISDRIVGPYMFDHVRVKSYGIYTNSTPAGSYRSIGGPQASWACESATDIIAADLGIDPIALRLKNLAKKGDELRRGKRPLEGDLAPKLRLVLDEFGWDSYVPVAPDPAHPNIKRGIGFAASVTNSGASPTSTSLVRFHADGSATVYIGTTEIGQGSRSAMAQIAAEELRIPLESIKVIGSDTDVVPYDRSTGSSRSTTLMGLAVHDAAVDVREQLMQLAAGHFETFADQLEASAGQVSFKGESITFGGLVREMFGGSGGELMGRGYVTSNHASGKLHEDPVFWEVSIGAAEVEVDEDTGAVRLLRYVSAADPGKAINPKQVEGQDEGAAMQAIGHTMFEEMLFEDGQFLNPNLVDYRVPTFTDLPDEFETVLIEFGDGPGPYGSKGVGEGGIVAVAPAIANAIFNATGVRVRDLPLTPERVWRAIDTAKRGS
jgi:CO/xanthine dehydrogenase Mo-binding subunit